MRSGSGDEAPDASFSLVLGGPLYQLYLRTRLARPPLELLRRRIVAFVVITWFPPALLAAATGRLTSGPVPFLFDLTNLQFLTTLPLLLLAEVIVHRRLGPLVSEFVRRDLIAPEDRARFEDIIARAVRLRNSVPAELALALLSITGGHWLWRAYASLHVATWYIVPIDGSMQLTLAGYCLAFVSLPIARFILLRWYFRLFIWYVLLWRVSRLRLRLNPLHSDRAGGLGFVEGSAMAFASVLVAQSAFLAMMLGNWVWHLGARLSDFKYDVLAFVVLLLVFVLAPLTFFATQLLEARLGGVVRYGQFASRYADAFDEKWLASDVAGSDTLLGTSDIQSLSDLANSYEVVRTMRLVLFDKILVVRLAILFALPFLPLVLAMVPLQKLLAAFISTIV